MYQSSTGRTPFADVQGMRILWAQLQDEPKDPREIRPDLPEEFVRAMMVALEKEREKRPARAGEYAQMLAQAAGSAPPPGPPPAPGAPAPAPGQSIRSSETRISEIGEAREQED
jgi:hypothetical protein